MIYTLYDFPEKSKISVSGLISGLKRTQIFITESTGFFNNIRYIIYLWTQWTQIQQKKFCVKL